MKYNIIIYSLLIFILIFSYYPILSYSHLDKPADPAIRVRVYIESVGLYTDQDDGIDGNAELIVKWIVNHHGHDNVGGIINIDDFNWDYERTTSTGGRERLFNIKVYEHYECSPMSRITLHAHIIEDDSDILTTIAGAIVAAGAAIVSTAVTSGASIIWVSVAGAGGLTSVFASINSADDLGSSSFTISSPGSHTVRTTDAFVRYRVDVDRVDGYDCSVHRDSGTQRPTTTTTTEEKHIPSEDESMRMRRDTMDGIRRSLDERLSEGTRAFQSLRESIGLILDMNAEPGNPARLTDAEIEQDRNTLASAILLDFVDPLVSLIVKMSLDTSNASSGSLDAFYTLYNARDLAVRGAYLESLDSYETAWRLSLENLFSKEPAGTTTSSLSIRIVDDDMNAVDRVIVELYKESVLVMSVIPENGIVAGIPLDEGLYELKVKAEILGFGLPLTSVPVDVEGPTTLTVYVSSAIVPVDSIHLLGYIVISVLLTSVALQTLRPESLKGFRRVLAGIGVFALIFALLYYIGG